MTPPAPRRAAVKRDSRGGKGLGSTEGMGICHAYAPDGRCISLLKILLTNFLHLRLPLLRQPQELERPPRPLHAGGGGRAHARLLPPQLHRGAVPLLRHHPLARLHDGADGRGGAVAARGARFPRLHPPEDDPRRRSRAGPSRPASMPTGCRSTSSCRPQRSLARLAPEKDGSRIEGAMEADARRRSRTAPTRRSATSPRPPSRRPASRRR